MYRLARQIDFNCNQTIITAYYITLLFLNTIFIDFEFVIIRFKQSYCSSNNTICAFKSAFIVHLHYWLYFAYSICLFRYNHLVIDCFPIKTVTNLL